MTSVAFEICVCLMLGLLLVVHSLVFCVVAKAVNGDENDPSKRPPPPGIYI